MKIALLPVAGIIILSFISFGFFPSVSASTPTTTTLTGWLFPDGTHFNNAIAAILFPIIMVGAFTALGRVLGVDGDFNVTNKVREN